MRRDTAVICGEVTIRAAFPEVYTTHGFIIRRFLCINLLAILIKSPLMLTPLHTPCQEGRRGKA